MANFPTSLDSSASLLTPVDRTSAKTLTTTLTAICLSGDTTLSVADAVTPGFAATDGVLSIGDELITYTGRTTTTFTGCTRGAFGTVASGHGLGASVTAKMVAGYVTRLQEAVIAVETALGIAGNYNFAPVSHGHLIADIQGLQTSLDAKAALSHTHAATDITSGTIAAARMPALTGDATTSAGTVATTVVAIRGRAVANIAPTDGQILAWNASNNRWEPGTLGVDSWIGGGDTIAEHTHIIADVTGLQDALDGKADTTHYHAAADVTSGTFDAARAWALSGDVSSSAGSGLVTVVALQARAMAATAPTSNQAILWNSSNSEWTPTTIAISHVSSLQAALDGKAALSHSHAQSDVSGLVSALAGKAAAVHTHVITDVTGLEAALAAATAGGPHTHSATDIVSGRLAPARMSPLAGDLGVFAPQFAEWGADEFGSGGTSLENLTELDIIVTAIRRRPISARAPLDRQYLQWDDARSEWGPGSVAISDVTDLTTTLDGKAASVHTHAQSDVTGLVAALAAKAASVHSHVLSHVTGLESALAGKADLSHSHGATDITSGTLSASRMPALSGDITSSAGTVSVTVTALQGRTVVSTAPSSGEVLAWSGSNWAPTAIVISSISGLQTILDGKAAASHTHLIADVTNLQTSLDAKSDVGHTHAQSDVTGLVAALAGKASSSHTHATSDITGLDAALAGKAASSHTHATSDITGLDTALAGKASSSHTHAQSDITNLVSDLAGKAASSHNHNASDINAGTLAADRMPALTGDATTSAGAVAVTVGKIQGRAISSTAPTDGQILQWVAGASEWQPVTLGTAGHAHIIADITGLQAALDGKAASVHTHAISNVAGLQTALDGKASSSHTHEQSDIVGLATTLSSKTDVGHTHSVGAISGLAPSATTDTTNASNITSGSLALARLAQTSASSGQAIIWNGSAWAPGNVSGASGGTVTSVALTAPAIFSVGGSPVTVSGTLALTLATQVANRVWAGPTTGADAAPTFRALVAADIPQAAVTQYQAALSIGWAQLTGVPSTFTPATHVHSADDITSGSLALARIAQSGATSNQVLAWNGTAWAPATPATGTVTSVALSAPAIFSVGGSPVTSSGTLALTLATQTANTFFAGPTTGVAATPTFRTIVAADIPSAAVTQYQASLSIGWGQLTSVPSTFTPSAHVHSAVDITSGSLALARIAQSGATSGQVLQWNGTTWTPATVSGGGGGTVTSVALSMPAIFSVGGSPVTSTGTLAVTLATQAANLVWAGPTTGAAATPTFRALVAADIPAASLSIGWSQLTSVPSTFAPSSHTHPPSQITQGGATSGQVLAWNGSAWAPASTTGTVTSVALSMPGIMSVAGSPITTSGTISVTLASQSANTVFAGPTSGAIAAPTFRALVVADLPTHTHTASQISGGTFAASLMPALTGDVTSSAGAVATRVVKIQGVSVYNAAPTAGQVLRYDSGNTRWAAATLAISDVSGLQSALDSKAASTHNQDASTINSGTLAAARMPALSGDTTSSAGSIATTVVALRGRAISTTAPTNGQALVWNSTSSQWTPTTIATGGASSSGAYGLVQYSDGVGGFGSFNELWYNGVLYVGTTVDLGAGTGYKIQSGANIYAKYDFLAGRDITAVRDVKFGGTFVFTGGFSAGIIYPVWELNVITSRWELTAKDAAYWRTGLAVYSTSQVYTKSEGDARYQLASAMSNYYTTSQVYTKTEADARYYTKTEINGLLGSYYTKSEINDQMALKSSSTHYHAATTVAAGSHNHGGVVSTDGNHDHNIEMTGPIS